MTGLTAHGFPYLDGSEVAGTGIPANSLSAANKLEDDVRILKDGVVSSGSVAAGGTLDVAVVFATPYPVGITPVVVLQRLVATTLPEVMESTVIARSNTGFTVRFKNTFSGALNWQHMWLARG